MGLRESLNENKAVVGGAAAGIVVLAVAFIVYRLSGFDERPTERPNQAWFTVDDGATYFADDIHKEAPFQTAEGKTAVRAHVYKCGDDGQPFVNHLERRPQRGGGSGAPPTGGGAKPAEGKGGDPEGDAPPDNPYAGAYSKGSTPSDPAARMAMIAIEVKKPGAGPWVPSSDPRAVGILNVVCPDGTKTNLQVVTP
jgi:hypothetical protein